MARFSHYDNVTINNFSNKQSISITDKTINTENFTSKIENIESSITETNNSSKTQSLLSETSSSVSTKSSSDELQLIGGLDKKPPMLPIKGARKSALSTSPKPTRHVMFRRVSQYDNVASTTVLYRNSYETGEYIEGNEENAPPLPPKKKISEYSNQN